MTRASRLRLRAAALACVLLPGAGCGGRSGGDPDPWSTTALEASKHATTEFGRTVLRDGIVSRAEYEESVSRLVACGVAKGVVIDATLRYGVYVFSAGGPGADVAFRTCTEGDLGTIQWIFYGRFTDPTNRGRVVTAECLVRKGALPSTYRFDRSRFDADVARLLGASGPAGRAHEAYEMCMYNPQDRTYP